MRALRPIPLLLLALAPLPALAYSHGKPGLWTMSTQMDMSQLMPNLTPEQQALFKQRGIALPGANGNTINTDVCITPEQAAQDTPQQANTQRHCHLENLKHSGKTWDADMVCDGPVARSGHSHVVFDSDEHYSGEATIQMTGPSQGPNQGLRTTTSHFSGQWKGADCGSIKPYESPR